MSVVRLGDFTVSHRTQFREEGTGRFKREVSEGARDAAEEMADRGAAYAIVNVATGLKTRSGRLLASIDKEMLSDSVGIFFADGQVAPHAAAQEKGAISHNIPNSFGRGYDFGFAQHRKNWDKGGHAFHPGNPAARFLAEAGLQLAAVSAGIVAKHMPKG